MREFIEKIKDDEKFAKKWGGCGPFYGVQRRNFSGVDQFGWVIKEIKKIQTFLGLPFNIASYALLALMVARVAKHKPGELVMALGDTHLVNYKHHPPIRAQISV